MRKVMRTTMEKPERITQLIAIKFTCFCYKDYQVPIHTFDFNGKWQCPDCNTLATYDFENDVVTLTKVENIK